MQPTSLNGRRQKDISTQKRQIWQKEKRKHHTQECRHHDSDSDRDNNDGGNRAKQSISQPQQLSQNSQCVYLVNTGPWTNSAYMHNLNQAPIPRSTIQRLKNPCCAQLLINLLKAPNYLNMWEAGKEKPQGQSKRQSQPKEDVQSAKQ